MNPALQTALDLAFAAGAFACAHPFLILGLYVLVMLVYRCFVESKRLVPAPAAKGWEAHRAEVERVRAQFASYLAGPHKAGKQVSLNRSRGGVADSNRTIAPLYKDACLKVDVSALDGLIALDEKARLMHVEPGMPQDVLARIALAHGWVPHVVLEFPGITAGGAVCGGGIESTSHKHGAFFDTVQECDIITGDGRYLTGVSRTHHADLFWGLSASFGTMGILTRLAVRIEPAPRYVHVRYVHAAGAGAAMKVMEAVANNEFAAGGRAASPDFIDGVALGDNSAVAVIGTGVNEIPAGVPRLALRQSRSDPWFFWHLQNLGRTRTAVTFEEVTAAAAREGKAPLGGSPVPAAAIAGEEWLDTVDYLFRFDRGAFWMARHGLQVFYGGAAWGAGATEAAGPAWLLRLKYAWLCTTRQLYRMLHQVGDAVLARTYIVQDFIMPSAGTATDLAAHTAAAPVGIWPLWLCPVRMMEARHPANAGFGFPVQATAAGDVWFNVGVYGLPNGGAPFDPVKVNKALEDRASALGGRKMLYAQSFYDEPGFWSLFDKAAYDRVRAAYAHGASVFPDVARKLLMGPDRLARLQGVLRPNLLAAWKPMIAWYFSLWGELLLPRALHPALNIHFTGMEEWAPVPGSAATTPGGSAAAGGAAGAGTAAEDAAGAPSSSGGRRRRRGSESH